MPEITEQLSFPEQGSTPYEDVYYEQLSFSGIDGGESGVSGATINTSADYQEEDPETAESIYLRYSFAHGVTNVQPSLPLVEQLPPPQPSALPDAVRLGHERHLEEIRSQHFPHAS